MTRGQKAAETRRINRERAAENRERAAENRERAAEIAAIVAGNCCPNCGSKLRRNLSLTGWWQCEQYGSPQFRKRPDDPACSWQGFTS